MGLSLCDDEICDDRLWSFLWDLPGFYSFSLSLYVFALQNCTIRWEEVGQSEFITYRYHLFLSEWYISNTMPINEHKSKNEYEYIILNYVVHFWFMKWKWVNWIILCHKTSFSLQYSFKLLYVLQLFVQKVMLYYNSSNSCVLISRFLVVANCKAEMF